MAATLTASHTTCVRDSQASLITPDPHGIPRCLPACWNLTQRTETLSSPFWSAPHLVLPCISKGNITQFRSHLESSLTLPAPSEFSSPLNFPSSPCRDLISTHSSASPLLSQSKASAMSSCLLLLLPIFRSALIPLKHTSHRATVIHQGTDPLFPACSSGLAQYTQVTAPGAWMSCSHRPGE